MLELGMANFTMFFVIIAIGLIFVIAWIFKSEARINHAKQEMAKLNEEIESYQREKFSLTEKISALESARARAEETAGIAVPQSAASGVPEGVMLEMSKKNEALEEENRRLKEELGEAKTSLEEVYKALSSQS